MAVYEKDTDDLGKLTGINPSEEASMDRSAHAGAAEDIADREQNGLYKPDRDSKGKTDSGEKLGNAEKTKDDTDPSSKPANKPIDFIQNARNKVGGLLKHKLALGLVVAGGGSMIGIILLIVFILGLFKIPNLAEHIVAYQFARVTRGYALRVDNVNTTKIGIVSAADDVWSAMKEKYTASPVGQATGKTSAAWTRVNDKNNPQRVIDNMQRDEKLKYGYTETKRLHRKQLSRITVMVDGKAQVIPVENLSLGNRLIPTSQFRADSRLASQVRPAMRAAMAADDIGPLVRSGALRKLRQQLGVSIVAWHIDKLKGKTNAEVRTIIEQETYEKVKGPSNPVNSGASTEIQKTAKEADEAEKATVKDPKLIQKVIGTNETAPSVRKILDNAFKATKMKTILSYLNPVYAIAAPLCMIYEGSLANNGDTINQADESSQRAFISVASAGSQVKDGYDANGQAAGAYGDKLGQIEESNPEKHASGLPVDTSKSPSNQSSPLGQFSIIDAIFPAPFDTVFENAAKTCPIFTNIWAGVAIAGLNIVPIIASGGTVAAGGAATEVAAQSLMRATLNKVVTKLITAKALTLSFGKGVVITGSAVVIGTYLAKYIVMSQMGSAQTSPLASGKAFVDNADAGGNSHAQLVDRTVLKGAPLSKPEVAYNNEVDLEYRASMIKSQSTYQRYFALSNADSLANHMGSMMVARVNISAFRSILSNALNPLHTLSTVANALMPAKTRAAASDTFNYGNVQWGNTGEEQRLLTTDPTYIVNVENQRILDASGKEEEINKKFGPCYDPALGAGDLMTKETGEKDSSNRYYLVRFTNGDIDPTQGLCSQKNLGPHNSEYGDLVFRWRVAGGYNSVLDQLDEIQNPTLVDEPLDASKPTPVGQPVDVGQLFEPSDKIACAPGTDNAGVVDGYHNGTAMKIQICGIPGLPSDGEESTQGSDFYIPASKGNALVNSRISGNILQLVKDATAAKIPMKAKSSFRTMAHQQNICPCDGVNKAKPGYSNHQTGLAIDFDLVDGKGLTASNYPTQNGSNNDSPDNPRIATSSPVWNWLVKNGSKYTMKQYYHEPWHWSPVGS